MSAVQIMITIAVITLGTMMTRFVPFLLFSGDKKLPPFISYLGRVLPPAVFGMLLVYCLKNVSILSGSHGIPEAIALTVVVLLHLKWRQMLLSIAGGTFCYMLLIQTIFA